MLSIQKFDDLSEEKQIKIEGIISYFPDFITILAIILMFILYSVFY